MSDPLWKLRRLNVPGGRFFVAVSGSTDRTWRMNDEEVTERETLDRVIDEHQRKLHALEHELSVLYEVIKFTH